MQPFVDDVDFQLFVGDVRDVLAGLPDESVDCAATSPPFFGLRDYGTGTWKGAEFYDGDPCPTCNPEDRGRVNGSICPTCHGTGLIEHTHDTVSARGGRGGSGTLDKRSGDAMPSQVPARVCSCGAEYHDPQIGLEATPEEWVAELVGVFREVRRVLKSTGTLWIECGDSYCSNVQGAGQPNEGHVPNAWQGRDGELRTKGPAGNTPMRHPTKPKDLLGQPWLLAFALRADGWWLRQAIIWHKPNAMPESATDRCTTAHSYVFLLSKQARYFFDAEAIAEEFSPNTNSRGKGYGVKGTLEERSGTKTNGRSNASWGAATQGDLAPHLLRRPQDETLDGSDGETPRGPDGRRVTHVEKGENSLQHRDGERWPNPGKNPRSVWTIPTQGFPEAHFATWPEALVERIIKAGCPLGGVILDPFMGSGTTALVARKLGRKSIGIELSPEYAAMCARRLGQQSLLAEEPT